MTAGLPPAVTHLEDSTVNDYMAKAVELMKQIGYTGAFPGDKDIYATSTEYAAAAVLTGHKDSNANVVLRLNALECLLASSVYAFSHAAAATAQVRIAAGENHDSRLETAYDRAVKRAERKEGEALEEMMAPDPAHELLRRLRDVARERGLIEVAAPGLYSVRFLANKIRSARHMRSVMDRHAIGRSGMAPGVPETYQRIKEELAARNISV